MNKNTLVINEIFHSIQGESLYAGCPCVFIRLTGCNLRCAYCDTSYAYSEGTEMDMETLINHIDSYPCNMVEITGGEPLFQKNTSVLVNRLLAGGYTVLMETNGSYDISTIDKRCIKIVDIKCPSSGESHHNIYDNIAALGPADQIKFVIQNKEDYLFAKQVIETHSFPFDMHHILFSPVSGGIAPHELAHWIIDDGLAVRLHLQLHKYIWPTIQRGV